MAPFIRFAKTIWDSRRGIWLKAGTCQKRRLQVPKKVILLSFSFQPNVAVCFQQQEHRFAGELVRKRDEPKGNGRT